MKKILVIDDEEQIRSLIAGFLEGAEFQVFQAEDGSSGVNLARECMPDLIISDINMPKMDGYRVLEILRNDPKTLSIPFVFLSAKGGREDVRFGMNLGADDYLSKPFRRAELLRAVQARLAKHALLSNHFDSALKQAEEKLDYVLHYDSLTGLPNRLTLRERLNQVMLQTPANRQVAILSCGLDRFKRINETMGYLAGDHLLRLVATRIVDAVTSNDTVARLNADQFAIILSGCSEKKDSEKVALLILQCLQKPFVINGQGIFSTGSIGITLYPKDGQDIDHLIRKAEAAMHFAKTQGGDTYEFYTSEIDAASATELALEVDLRYALERNELSVSYQPQVSLRTGEIFGAEALLRWRHPQKGMISPNEFIPIAEKRGMIVQIGEWVLRSACSQVKKWQEAGHHPFTIAVNLTGHHFSEQNLTERLIHILRETSLEPGSLDVELTESILMKDVPTAVATLNELKHIGIQISIDDFGTGYSSLSYLKRFPFHTLKIDQSFIRNVSADSKNAFITMALIQLAHNLDLKVIAEGVETNSELSFLSQNGCDAMQGYLFSRAVPVNEFENLLNSGKKLALE